MKRKIVFIVILLLVGAALGAASNDDQTILRWVNSEEGLRLRDAPNLKSATLAVIPHFTEVVLVEERGDPVEISGVLGKWSKVEWRYNTIVKTISVPITGPHLPASGWVFGGFLSSSKDEIKRSVCAKLDGEWFEVKLPEKGNPDYKFNSGLYVNIGYPLGRIFYEFRDNSHLTVAFYARGAGEDGNYELLPQMVIFAQMEFGSDQDSETHRSDYVFRIESLKKTEMRILYPEGPSGWKPRLLMRGKSEIHQAIEKNNLAELKKLLSKYDDDPNYAIMDKVSLLHYAAYYDSVECAEYLIQKGAKVNVTNVYGITPLHFAAYSASFETAQLLLKNGARKDIGDITGLFPFRIAEKAQALPYMENREKYKDVIELLWASDK